MAMIDATVTIMTMIASKTSVNEAAEKVDDYELTPSYSYKLNAATGQITTIESPWIVKDDEGKDSYSLLPPAVVVGMIKQISQVLGL